MTRHVIFDKSSRMTIGRKFLIIFLLFSLGVFYASIVHGLSAIFSDGFESDFSEWTGNDQKWTTSGTSSATGVHDGLKRGQVTGNTAPGDDILLKIISTSDKEGITLEFWYRIYKGLEDDDHVYVEWTGDGSSWQILADFTATGDSASWEKASYNLPAGADNKSNFGIRFRAVLGAASSDIFYLDDVTLSANSGGSSPTSSVSPESSAEPATPTPTPATSATPTSTSPAPTPSATLAPTPSQTFKLASPSPLIPTDDQADVPVSTTLFGGDSATPNEEDFGDNRLGDSIEIQSENSGDNLTEEHSESKKENGSFGAKLLWWTSLIIVVGIAVYVTVKKYFRNIN